MKNKLSHKETAYTKKRNLPTRVKIMGADTLVYVPEYVQALEEQDEKKTAEIASLKAALAEVQSRIDKVLAMK